MSIRLSVRARRQRQQQIGLLVLAIALSLGGLAWQQRWLPPELTGALEQKIKMVRPVVAQIPLLLGRPERLGPTQAEPVPAAAGFPQISTVALVNAQVIENPESDAFTAKLLQDNGEPEPIPWPNTAGRTRVEIYMVQPGDSLWGIANKFELDLDTLRWSNPELERNPDVLAVGTKLNILPVAGVYHIVAAGDTPASIASLYGVTEADITTYPPNALYPPYDLVVGQGVIVPFGRKDIILPRPAPSTDFLLAWPLVGVVTGSFSAGHPAFDIGAPYGSTVYAAAGGQVTYANWAQEGFGYTLIIDHGAGMESWYSHLKGTLLQAGGYVNQGTPIGEVGSTGHSTGPHVHFEVRVNGVRVNPADYLSATPQ
jgi:LysM repeat protein